MTSYNPLVEEQFNFDPIIIMGFKVFVTRYTNDTYVSQIQECSPDTGNVISTFVENFFSDDFPTDEQLEEAIVDQSDYLAWQDNHGVTNV